MALAIFLLSGSAPVLAFDSTFGIDRSNLSMKKSKDAQAKTLAGIRALGAHWFKDGYTASVPGGFNAFIGEARLAKQNSLNILYNVGNDAGDSETGYVISWTRSPSVDHGMGS